MDGGRPPLPRAFPSCSRGLQSPVTWKLYVALVSKRRRRAHGDRPGSGDPQLVTDPQLSGEPHTPRTPVDSQELDYLQQRAIAAAERVRDVTSRSVRVIVLQAES